MESLISKRNLPLVILNIITILIVAIMLTVSKVSARPNQTTIEVINPGLLSYQGTLMNSSGNPVTGTYEITFRIYNSPTSTSPLWEELRLGENAVPVQNGLFNVMLGSLNPIPNSVWESSELFLGMKIGSDDEMNPREKLTTVPIAQVALSVPDGSITQSDAPSLIASADSQNIKMYVGRGTAVSVGTNTLLSTTINISPGCNNLVDAFVQPHYNWTPFMVATIGNPWDGSQFRVFLSRTDGGSWGDGQSQGFSYLVLCQQ